MNGERTSANGSDAPHENPWSQLNSDPPQFKTLEAEGKPEKRPPVKRCLVESDEDGNLRVTPPGLSPDNWFVNSSFGTSYEFAAVAPLLDGFNNPDGDPDLHNINDGIKKQQSFDMVVQDPPGEASLFSLDSEPRYVHLKPEPIRQLGGKEDVTWFGRDVIAEIYLGASPRDHIDKNNPEDHKKQSVFRLLRGNHLDDYEYALVKGTSRRDIIRIKNNETYVLGQDHPHGRAYADSVSPSHLQITCTHGELDIQDLDSANGTMIACMDGAVASNMSDEAKRKNGMLERKNEPLGWQNLWGLAP